MNPRFPRVVVVHNIMYNYIYSYVVSEHPFWVLSGWCSGYVPLVLGALAVGVWVDFRDTLYFIQVLTLN